MTDEQTIAWVTGAAARNQLFGRPIGERTQYGRDGAERDLTGDYLGEAARVMIPGRAFAIHRDDAGAHLALLETPRG